VYTAQNLRERPEGFNSLGSRALRIQVCFNRLNTEPKEGRLDSGADITLLSEDELKSWENAPKPKQGMRMKLFHLTGHAKVLGYVRFKMFALTEAGEFVQFTVEAYVVRGMKVPILLGEDFQSAYELGVRREASGKSEVLLGKTGKVIPASSSQDVKIGFNIQYAFSGQTYARSATRRRGQRRARRYPAGLTEVYAKEDKILAPGSVFNVPVTGPFEGRSDWLVEKIAIGGSDSMMSAPTTWISSDDPKIPIANPSTRPHYLRAGD
ncbi:hypothetical protein K525DRAFT_160833, partial [Schizophyllum commune Loenen D]